MSVLARLRRRVMAESMPTSANAGANKLCLQVALHLMTEVKDRTICMGGHGMTLQSCNFFWNFEVCGGL